MLFVFVIICPLVCQKTLASKSTASGFVGTRKLLTSGSTLLASKKPEPAKVTDSKKPLLRTFSLRPGAVMQVSGQQQQQENRRIASRQKRIDEYNAQKKTAFELARTTTTSGVFPVSNELDGSSHDLFNLDQSSSHSSQSLNNSLELSSTHSPSPSPTASVSTSFSG